MSAGCKYETWLLLQDEMQYLVSLNSWVWVCVPSLLLNYCINVSFSKALGGAQCTKALFVLSISQLCMNLNKSFLLQELLLGVVSGIT